MAETRLQLVRNVAGMVVLGGCIAVVVGRSILAAPPPAQRAATEAERKHIALDLLEPEARWRRSCERRFPGDQWSQDDDFHRLEQSRVRAIAGRLHVRLTDVLRAIDEGLREHPEGHRVTASPCKPRPFYD